jgi:uncharacterized protein YdeI (YjbR/CyaY-like superfamily)
MTPVLPELYFKTSADWRKWLKANHNRSPGVWLVFYKKDSCRPTMDYEDSVCEALCFGWIDSIIKKLDSRRYARKFTPRKDGSQWSALNKKRIEKLIAANRMTPVGLKKIESAKLNGKWHKSDRPQMGLEPSGDFMAALNSNKKAKENFSKLAPTYKRHYLGWINSAKLDETRKKRITEAIGLLEKGQKLGLK